jgi:hypothetical protein
VRRDIQIVSAARIDDGFITARVRTSNVIYVSKGLTSKPEFDPAREMHLDEIWTWTGKSWGGLADGTSIVEPRCREPGENAPGDHRKPLPPGL